MKEKNIQTLFNRQNRVQGVFELKLCKGKSIRWDSVKDHQVKALSMAAGEGLMYKIPDSPVPVDGNGKQTRFTPRKPFDCFFVGNFPAYVAICWYVPRKRKTLYYIDIDTFVSEKAKATRKSFREEDAFYMATQILELTG
jgi:hypothetical protein